MLRIKENALELFKEKHDNEEIETFLYENILKEISVSPINGTTDYIFIKVDDSLQYEVPIECIEEYEEIEEELEEPKEILTTKQKNIMFVIVTITILAFFLWFKFGVKPLDESDLKYINGLKIDKSIYLFERDLTQLKFDLEDTIKLKEKQEKEIENIENSLKELRDKK